MKFAGAVIVLVSAGLMYLGVRLLDLLAPADSTPGSFDRALRGLFHWRPWLGLLCLAGGIGGLLTGILFLWP